MAINPQVISATPDDEDQDQNQNVITPVTTPPPTTDISGGGTNNAIGGSATPASTTAPTVTQNPLLNDIQNAIGPNPTTLPPAIVPTTTSAPSNTIQATQAPTTTQSPLAEGIQNALSGVPQTTQAPITTPAPTINPAYNNTINNPGTNQSSLNYNNILKALQGNVQETTGNLTYDANSLNSNPAAVAQINANANSTVPAPITTPAPTAPASADQIFQDYQKYLGRTPSQQELLYYTQQAANGITPDQIQAEFMNSPEFQTKNATLINQITQDYQNYLGRNPDQAGLQYWINQALSGTPVTAQQFEASQEYQQDVANKLVDPTTGLFITTAPITTAAPVTTQPVTTTAPVSLPPTVTDSTSAAKFVQNNIAQINNIIKADPTLSNPADIQTINNLVSQSQGAASQYATGTALQNVMATLANYTTPANAETTAQWVQYIGTAPTAAQVQQVQQAVAAGQTPQQAMDALYPLTYPKELGPSSSAGYGAGATSAATNITNQQATNSLGIPTSNNPWISLGGSITGGIAGSIAAGALAGALGGTIAGFEAGSVLGPIGSIAGAIIGTLISSLFGGHKSVGPDVQADVDSWNQQTNAPNTETSADNGGNASVGTQLATIGGTSVGSLINAMGGQITNYPRIAIGYFKGKYFVYDAPSGATNENNQFTNVQDAISDFMYRSIQNIVKANGVTGLTKSQTQALLNLTPQTISAYVSANQKPTTTAAPAG